MMKLPNGFGTVYRMKGNRRRPFVVKKTIEGRQKILGYFDTFEHGLSFLVDVNRDPSAFSDNITFKELYARWKVQKFPNLSTSSRKGYENSYRHCEPLHDMSFSAIRFGHLQGVIDTVKNQGIGYCTQKKIRGLMEQLYAYALKYDLAKTNYAQYVDISPHVKKYPKHPFTVRQRNKLWRNLDDMAEVADVLIMIYTGLRIGEYIQLKASDVKLRSHYFIVRQSKTDAGRNRPVPIHKSIYPWFVQRIKSGQQYICQQETGILHTYSTMRRRFDAVMEHFHMHHTPHETRHTTASMLDSAGANDTATKKILGHACKGVTKHDYTHKTIRDLRKAIDMI